MKSFIGLFLARYFRKDWICLTCPCRWPLQLQLRPEPLTAIQPDSAAEALWVVVVSCLLRRGWGTHTKQAGQLRHLWRWGSAHARWVQVYAVFFSLLYWRENTLTPMGELAFITYPNLFLHFFKKYSFSISLMSCSCNVVSSRCFALQTLPLVPDKQIVMITQ